MTEKKVMKLASRGKRFGAACIDTVVPAIAYLIYSAVLQKSGIMPPSPGYGYGNNFGYGYGYGYDLGYGYGYGLDRISGAEAALLAVVSMILIAYVVVEFVFYAKGKSIGKAILGLQVVSSVDGRPFRFWKMVFRECFVKAASGSVFGLGYIWILLDEKNRGWHDKILDTYVVDLKESEKMNLRKRAADTRAADSDEVSRRIENAGIQRAVAEAAEPEIKEAEPEVIDVTETSVIVEPVEETAAEELPEEPEVIEVSEISEEPAAAEIAEEADSDDQLAELSMAMTNEELLQAARERGVQVSSRATKAAIIEAVNNAKTEE